MVGGDLWMAQQELEKGEAFMYTLDRNTRLELPEMSYANHVVTRAGKEIADRQREHIVNNATTLSRIEAD